MVQFYIQQSFFFRSCAGSVILKEMTFFVFQNLMLIPVSGRVITYSMRMSLHFALAVFSSRKFRNLVTVVLSFLFGN